MEEIFAETEQNGAGCRTHATALVALAAMGLVDSVDIPSARHAVIAWAVVWFELGYAL